MSNTNNNQNKIRKIYKKISLKNGIKLKYLKEEYGIKYNKILI
jgi:hypothetical protein